MIELPDDELDKLFRKSSEELDSTYEPQDWNALKKRLDQEDGKTPAGWLRRWWPIGMLAFLIPAGLGLYFLLTGESQIKISEYSSTKINVATSTKQNQPAYRKSAGSQPAANQLQNSESKGDKVKESAVGEKLNAESKNINESDPEESLVTKKEAESGKIEKSKILPRSRSKAGGVYLEPNHSNGKGGDGAFFSTKGELAVQKASILKKENSIAADDTPIARGNQEVKDEDVFGQRSRQKETGKGIRNGVSGTKITGQNNLIASSSEYSDEIVGKDSVAVKEESKLFLAVEALANLPFALTARPVSPKVEVPESVPVMQPAQEKPQNLSPKLAIRVGYSPDLTTVGLKNFTKPGSAFSVLVEYGLSRRLYAQTGIVRSVKDYYANASDYKLMSYVTQINTPDNVDGTCNMIEIPLGVRYDLAQNARSRWFVGTGFTSYYIQKEKYVYNYKNYVHGQKYGWEGNTGWYLLSHINASAGFEYRISNKFSVLAEPYVRIPIKGVGYGKVNLVTTGMWLSLRYTPYFFK